jgi:hypothetical protein
MAECSWSIRLGHRLRTGRSLQPVMGIIQQIVTAAREKQLNFVVNHIELAAEKTKQLFLKYGKYMSRFPDSPPSPEMALREISQVPGLELPIDPEFISLPPRMPWPVMLRRLEETMPWRSTQPGEEARRAARKIDVEFVL